MPILNPSLNQMSECPNDNLTIVSAWFYEHPHCTDSDILFLFILTNVLTVSCFG